MQQPENFPKPENFPTHLEALETLLNRQLLIHRPKLKKLWHSIQGKAETNPERQTLQAQFFKHIEESQTIINAKINRRPEVSFPQDLPICLQREVIETCFKNNQVIILAGETGSGKTTQLPKICLSLGQGIWGQIGHTQPRRIAASTVAQRIAQELNQPLGDTVSYQVRFNETGSPHAAIKVMTDGILLAEIRHDPWLLKYDTLIIDEAHERSLNIDFLLGYIKKILPHRPDLKVIVTSATIDLQRFSDHFNGAPILEISGRTYPVEILYRPRLNDQVDQNEAILEALHEILARPWTGAGDVLIFLPGERDIRETAQAIRKSNFSGLEVLPLYARLSLADQTRVFQAHKGRRVVLATNVAETSVTVPGIGFVIDTGTARISRYSARTKVQRLPIEAIAKASARQRAGRCGRIGPGVCIRLYAEDDFNQRPEFTDAEIVRTHLASVVLKMLHLKMGDIRNFPFVEAPDNNFINDGYKLLEELQAVNSQGQLTSLGYKMAELPLDPKLARMLLQAHTLGCLSEVLIITSALSIQDPRERPAEKQQAADEKHRRFWDEESDFLAYLKVWQYAEEQRQSLTQNQWRKQCEKDFLSYLRLREWRELHHQLRIVCKHIQLKENIDPAQPTAIHKSLLVGLISHVGNKQEEQGDSFYLGVRNRKFSIFPGSSVFKKRPKWVLAATLLETSKLYAHGVAKIEPEWIIEAAQHLIQHHYYQPHYQIKTGQVVAYDRMTLYGLVLLDKKIVNYGALHPEEAHTVFIRQALVEMGYGEHPSRKGKSFPQDFYAHNLAEIENIQELEAKSRRRDILVDDQRVYQFYAERIPSHIVNFAGFEHWRKQSELKNPQLLFMPPELLMRHSAELITEEQFPKTLKIDSGELPIYYHFEPGHVDDGVNLTVPVNLLHTLPEKQLEWLVPGLLREKCMAILKCLPKQWRKLFVPVPHYVDLILPKLQRANKSLVEAMHLELERVLGRPMPKDIWTNLNLDAYYLMNIQVVNDHHQILDRGRDLVELRQRYRTQVQTSLQDAGRHIERTQIQQWDFGELLDSCTLTKNTVKVKAFPALVHETNGVALRLLDNPQDAAGQSRLGVVTLALQALRTNVKHLQKDLFRHKQLALTALSIGPVDQVILDIVAGALQQLCFDGRPLPRTQDEFESFLQQGKPKLIATCYQYELIVLQIAEAMIEIKKKITALSAGKGYSNLIDDLNVQIEHLFSPGFLRHVPWLWLEQYPKYLKAILTRLDKAPLDLKKDKSNADIIQTFWIKHTQRLTSSGEVHYFAQANWVEFRWMIEEFRVSLFAQHLKTRAPVSEKRLLKIWSDLIGQ